MLLEASWPSVWQNGTKEGGRQEGRPLLLRFTVGGGRARVATVQGATEVSLGRGAVE